MAGLPTLLKIKTFFISILAGALAFSFSNFSQGDFFQNRDLETASWQKAWQSHLALKESSPFKNLQWRSVGPEFQGGRISSIAGHPSNPYIIYAAAGSGGLWKTVNNGTTWSPIFDSESSLCIGAIAVSVSNPDDVWVGSGEELMARSSYAGTGIFKSKDGGKTWENMGLSDSHHIARIVIDPKDPDVVYVAVLGHEYTFNAQRGLFKTTDGGLTWQKILFINERTGAVEVVTDPSDSRVLYAAMWEHDRKPWNNIESGEGSGLWKTEDGGLTWKRLTNGFPTGKYVGRIGLAVSKLDPNTVYALMDNQAPRPVTADKTTERPEQKLTITQVEALSVDRFLELNPKVLDSFLGEMNVPREYTAAVIQEMVKKGELTPRILAQYVLNLYLDRRLHVTNVVGGEVYRSDDKGETWKKVNRVTLDGFFDTYGYSFCDIRISPDDADEIYILGIQLLKSVDGGQNFRPLGRKNVHADCHDLWIDPKNPLRLILGTDGGLNFSYDRGETWQKINNLPIGEFYTISLDAAKPYAIYGGLQDNGTVFGPSRPVRAPGEKDPWRQIAGGDGFFVEVDPTDARTLYFEYQFGSLIRKNLRDNSVKNIMPQTKIGESPLRCNWMTPFIISKHNPYILYYGANRLFKSYNRGDSWISVSPDLTTNPGPDQQGDVPFGTITTISESPLKPGLLYVGTDDGRIQRTQDDGVSWKEIGDRLPSSLWISRVVASQYEEGSVFAALSGYRKDDFGKYLFFSDDYGQSWKSIASNLPAESVNVIREDPKQKNILYVGTDRGVYASLDRGKTWASLCSNLPGAAVHDLAVHPRDPELVIGTHGRSVYVLDIGAVRELNQK
jgi:photosystem II stability/assembly factor-like uncharacterized protein